ncbi:hypothetical protein [Borrelia hermsii]|uniref:hypothetical protein n=1 Tax=Borrelia hermsii TaxID=140 RepID=UPI001FF53409|nr:hypothetical protein [Borrelia hermsii]UPA08346.1 hypothetical protein bhDAH_000989 [Borrelia hermsii DAH]
MLYAKIELVEKMMDQRDEFEEVLLSKVVEKGAVVLVKPYDEEFTCSLARHYLDIFLRFCLRNPHIKAICGITKIKEKSLSVNKHFRSSMFVDLMLIFLKIYRCLKLNFKVLNLIVEVKD